MALACPRQDCAICLESLALYGRAVVVAVPCGNCLHKRCFDAWSAERTAENLAIPCPWCNQVVKGAIICFPFESDPDENVENGDTDTEPRATRQAFNRVLLWRGIVTGILPVMMVVLVVAVSDEVDNGWIFNFFFMYYLSLIMVIALDYRQTNNVFFVPPMIFVIDVTVYDVGDNGWIFDFFFFSSIILL
jgi:hypothetical protein